MQEFRSDGEPFLDRRIIWPVYGSFSCIRSGLWKQELDAISDSERLRSIRTAYIIDRPVSLRHIPSSRHIDFDRDHLEPFPYIHVIRYQLARVQDAVPLQ